jgi:hypothetical protein
VLYLPSATATSTEAATSIASLRHLYKQITVYLRSLYTLLRALPGYQVRAGALRGPQQCRWMWASFRRRRRGSPRSRGQRPRPALPVFARSCTRRPSAPARSRRRPRRQSRTTRTGC